MLSIHPFRLHTFYGSAGSSTGHHGANRNSTCKVGRLIEAHGCQSCYPSSIPSDQTAYSHRAQSQKLPTPSSFNMPGSTRSETTLSEWTDQMISLFGSEGLPHPQWFNRVNTVFVRGSHSGRSQSVLTMSSLGSSLYRTLSTAIWRGASRRMYRSLEGTCYRPLAALLVRVGRCAHALCF